MLVFNRNLKRAIIEPSTMKNLSEYLSEEKILLDLEGVEFEDCLPSLVNQLTARGIMSEDQGENLRDALTSRERLGATCVGRGVVIPHAYLPAIEHPLVCFARLKTPVDHEAPDGAPVDLVFMLTGPPESQNVHLQMLARIVRLVHDQELLTALRDAHSASEVLSAVQEVEQRHA